MSLLPKITSGIKWSAISYLGRQGMQFLTTAILARLILPDQFGLVGMALVVIGFLNIFKDLGTSSALIQRERLSSELLSSIFWINVLFGLFAMLLTAILAPLVADFYQEPQVTSILRGFSIIFPISGLSILHQSLLQRDQDFNKLGRIEIGAALVGSIVGISAALLGSGAWSLVYQSLAVTLMTTSLLWVMTPWRPNLYFSIEEVKSISNYSLNLVGFSIFNYFARNTDYILIGKFLGSEPLGYYTLAYQIMLYPVQIVSQIISRVMFPAYARIQDNLE
jgi:O-antigen/teichoic acid export membrane protein